MTIRYVLGNPDYSAASLREIIGVLEDFSDTIEEDIHRFEKIKKKIEENVRPVEKAKLVMSYIQYWNGLLKDFQVDFKRILDEIPEGVAERHLDTLRLIYCRGSSEQLNGCPRFEETVLDQSLGNELLSSLAEQAFELIFQRFTDNMALNGLSDRLRAFIGSRKDQQARTKGVGPLDIPEGLSWGDISMRFLDKECLDIRAGGRPLGAKNFAVLGFENKKNRSPDTLWFTLFALGENEGEITWKGRDRSGELSSKLKKNISILRKRLNDLFGISEDPFYPYIEKRAYKAKFSITVRKEDT